MYYNDEEAAIEHLANNLKCIYTRYSTNEKKNDVYSTGSWSLLSKLWEQQLQKSPQDYHLKESIAATALTAGLTTTAISQYMAAATQALEQQKYVHALKLIMRAEEAVVELESSDTWQDLRDSENIRSVSTLILIIVSNVDMMLIFAEI